MRLWVRTNCSTFQHWVKDMAKEYFLALIHWWQGRWLLNFEVTLKFKNWCINYDPKPCVGNFTLSKEYPNKESFRPGRLKFWTILLILHLLWKSLGAVFLQLSKTASTCLQRWGWNFVGLRRELRQGSLQVAAAPVLIRTWVQVTKFLGHRPRFSCRWLLVVASAFAPCPWVLLSTDLMSSIGSLRRPKFPSYTSSAGLAGNAFRLTDWKPSRT